jgi:hypothetical protein
LRTLSTTLLGAQQGRTARPCVRVTIDDRHVGVGRLRPELLYEGGEAAGPAALAIANGFLLRAYTEGTGRLWLCRTEASSGGGWDAWSLMAEGVNVQAAVALAVTATGVYLFWVSGDGGSLLCRRSDDGGSSWAAPELVRQAATGSRVVALAAVASPAHDCVCLMVEDGQGTAADDVVRVAWRRGTWASAPWSRGMGDRTAGLAAVRQSGDATFVGIRFVLCGRFEDTARPSARLYHLQLTAAGERMWLYRGPLLVSDAADYAWAWPALVAGEGDAPRLFLIESTAHGSRLGHVVLSPLALDGVVTASDCTPLPWQAPQGIGAGAAAGHLYLGCGGWVLRSPVYGSLAEQRLDASADVVAYDAAGAPRGGAGAALRLLLDNGGGRYGRDRAPALRPGSQVCLSEGYWTAAGGEVVPQAPYWVEEIERSERSSPLPGGQVSLRCYDGWGKLRRSTSDRAREWSCSPAELLAEVLGRLGFCYSDDGSPSLYSAAQAPRFSLAVGQSWGGLVGEVLDYCGCELRFLVDPAEEPSWPSARAHAFTPDDRSTYAYGATAHPLREAALSEREAVGAWVQVYGDGVFGEAVDDEATAVQGFAAVRQAVDLRLNAHTDVTAQMAAGYLLRRCGEEGRGGSLVARPNVGQELLDVVTVQVGAAAEERRVVGIERRYDRLRGTFEHRLLLGGV